tara:strand:+ start:2594 stop:3460 length:867 start_codon:yes stop_codon:yes gene_type:complete
MKVLFSILMMVGVVSADTGISMSYRSIPMKLNVEYRGEFYRTMETASLNIYFDDFLRGRDQRTKQEARTVYYLKHYREPDDENPIGKIWYEEVDLEGKTAEEYNLANWAWLGGEGYIYKMDVASSSKLENSWLPDTINPSKGAGYIFGLNLNIGSVSGLVDMYSFDLYLGKRITLLPHLLHTYFKVAPSLLVTSWDIDLLDYRFSNTQMGAVANVGVQVQALKGVKIFIESEWRVYGPHISQETTSELTMVNKVPFWDKKFVIDTNDKEGSVRGIVRESLRFGMRFSF